MGAKLPLKKKKRLTRARLHIQFALAAHTEAKAHAVEWSAKSIAFREAGNAVEADSAERTARSWLETVLHLEALTQLGKRQRRRSQKR